MEGHNDKLDKFLNSEIVDNDFFIDIVECKLKIKQDEFKLRLVFITTGKNENYASIVYRAKICIEIIESKGRKFIDVIIKALLIEVEILEVLSIFESEIFVYENVIENLEKIYTYSTNENIKFGPQCLKVVFVWNYSA
ncbi:hypothetical protein PVAND_005369 [Polypedilum vanderplanki]|uniref:Uncharacterized protein n=1 Tax=Polypedilum vanderplanki TaxID=319348 RepID=A0A9J6C0X1_POLVA|nr:hypothetical protein PVAND_005369 [Polypedilum vanderplanki]